MTQETEKLANDNSSMNFATHTHSDTLNIADTHRHKPLPGHSRGEDLQEFKYRWFV